MSSNGQFAIPPFVTMRARRGKVTPIFKRAGFPQHAFKSPIITVDGKPFATAEFLAEYAGVVNGAATSPALSPATPMDEIGGSLAWLCSRYYKSDDFKLMCWPGARQRRKILEMICASPCADDGKPRGCKAYASWTRGNVKTLRDDIVGTTTTKNNAIKALRCLFNWAVDSDLAQFNPAAKLKPLALANPDGFYTWTADDVAKFEARHPLGTMARLAFAIQRYTALRASDVIRISPAMIVTADNGERAIHLQEFKGARSVLKPTKKLRDFPMRPELQAAIDAMPVATATGPYLRNDSGGAFINETFRTYVKRWAAEAGCDPRCTSHGLRKFVSCKLIDENHSPHTVAALLGHTTIAQVVIYAKKRDEKRLARRAVAAA